MRHFKLFGVLLRLSTLNELQYRANFFMELFNSILAAVTGIAGLGLVFYHTNSLGGWSGNELLVVMGVYLFIGGILNVIIFPNMEGIMADIEAGTLDYTLVKPEDAQFLGSFRKMQIWKTVDLLLGAGLILYAVIQLGETVGIVNSLLFATTLFAGGVMVYCLWLVLTTTAFWFVRVYAVLSLLESIYQAGRWPVDLYPAGLQIALTFLVPVAFAVTVPAGILTGHLDWRTAAGAVALAAVMFAASRAFWLHGLKHYGGASA
jgi:ABC-2 type transport system permease protein